jgi:Carboxypeptidase regulatory-like domain
MMTRTSIPLWTCALLLLHGAVRAQDAPPAAAAPQVDVQRSKPLSQRIPQQNTSAVGALQGMVLDNAGRPVPAVQVQLIKLPSTQASVGATSGDGIFRLLRVPPGTYDLVLTPKGGAAVRRDKVELRAGEVLSIEVRLPTSVTAEASPLAQTYMETLDDSQYQELSRRPDAEGAIVVPKETFLPDESANFQPQRDRWGIPIPNYHRYEGLETPYILGHWYDPFNRNELKADKPIFGKTFFSFTGDAITASEGRRLPTPTGQSTTNPGEMGFFGKGGQFFLAQIFRTTGDLFHGDTSAFRPVDWRIRVTMAANLNYLDARENQVVCADVRCGTTRFDTHVSLQEAFGEVKLHDFGPNYDFVNIRAGIQSFVSDFRGFIFADEQPGVRLFGNLKSNRFQYNLVGFDLLEKNTNSGLNTFSRRGREVAIANLFIQDTFFKGYTSQFSYHFVRDEGTTHYNDNGFLVRPAPIVNFTPHRIDADYFGWTGDGHIGRTNVTHAFYQVLGHDDKSEFTSRSSQIDAQFAAIELSQDRDWLRFRTSFLYASGDGNPIDRVSRGFSSIVDGVAFAGGEFSFYNREGIPLTRAGIALKSPDSFLSDLRTDKDEGQSNFVNPGTMLTNVGFDADVTQKLKFVGNLNFIQFVRTQTLDFLLQQQHVPRTVGFDTGAGIIYRPFLSDNIILHAGATALIPNSGLRQIYNSQTLISGFILLKFQF